MRGTSPTQKRELYISLTRDIGLRPLLLSTAGGTIVYSNSEISSHEMYTLAIEDLDTGLVVGSSYSTALTLFRQNSSLLKYLIRVSQLPTHYPNRSGNHIQHDRSCAQPRHLRFSLFPPSAHPFA